MNYESDRRKDEMLNQFIHDSRTPSYFILLLCVSSLACTGSPDIPDAPSGPPDPTADPAFCGKAGTDLLTALDGSWSLQQGAGVAHGGPFAIPLSPHPPAPIYFKYDPQRGLMDAQGYDQVTEMVMFPVVNEQQNLAEKLLKKGDIDTSKISGSSCGWDALPIFIGTEKYFFSSDPGVVHETVVKKYLFCDTIGDASLPINALTVLTVDLLRAAFREQCKRPLLHPEDDSGGMTMTLVVRFVSPRYGLGTLFFKGTDKSTITVDKRDPFELESPYRAHAPVTLFR